MIKIYYGNPVLEDNAYLIEPFHKITDLVVEKYISENIFQDILDILFRYFKTVKKHRNIDDVDNAFEYVKELLKSFDLNEIRRKELEKESDNLKVLLKDFIEVNFKQFMKTLHNANSEFFSHIWISSIKSSFEIFSNTLKGYKRKMRLLKRVTRRTRQYMEKHLEDLFKALFLVFFRIIEQIYMIANKESFIPQMEMEYLIEDVVYLENIARIKNETIF